jgi:enamine deaminase RidA (YjgF/YER057c/UK114 family)
MAETIAERLRALNITLPPVGTPAAAYVPFVRTGNLVFVSGNIARRADGSAWVGQLGAGMTTADGQQAARSIAIQLLGTLQAATGDLARVRRIVKLLCLVNSTPTFIEHHLVANGCSELLGQVLGPEVGPHARSAFGVAQIPQGACVEIELIAEVQ